MRGRRTREIHPGNQKRAPVTDTNCEKPLTPTIVWSTVVVSLFLHVTYCKFEDKLEYLLGNYRSAVAKSLYHLRAKPRPWWPRGVGNREQCVRRSIGGWISQDWHKKNLWAGAANESKFGAAFGVLFPVTNSNRNSSSTVLSKISRDISVKSRCSSISDPFVSAAAPSIFGIAPFFEEVCEG